MKRTFTKLTAALALLTLLVPIGAWGQGTTVASFSRSGTTNNVTGGTFSAQAEGKTGYYQDGSGTKRYVQVLNNSAYWTTTPTSITLESKIGGGTSNTDLSNDVYAVLLDNNGNEITTSLTSITSYITTNTGDNYTKTLPLTNNVYGVRIYHVKETGYNVRYYSFSLSYVAGGGDTPTPTTYTVTYDCNGGTSGCPQNVTGIEAGSTIELADAPSKTDNDFAGWSDGTDVYEAGEEYEVSGNVTFTAQWTSNGNEPAVTLDFTSNDCWDFPTSKTEDENTFTCGDFTITLKGSSANGYYYYANGHSLLNGKSGAYLQLPAFTFDVEKIVVVGASGASASVKQNIFVDDDAVSTETTGATGTNTYIIESGYETAGNIFTLKVTSSHNTQITQIKVYEKQSSNVPSFTISNNDELAYNATSGSFNFTVNNSVEGGYTIVSEEVAWISNPAVNNNTNTVSFDIETNPAAGPREGVVTLTYHYGEETKTHDVTITQAGNPDVVDYIVDITELNHSYHVKGEVVATNARGFVIGDGTGYVYTYLNATPTQQIGDKLSISGSTATYGHILQFNNTATIGTVEQTNYYGTPAVEVITEVPDYSEGYHLSTYLQFEGLLTKTGDYYYVAVGESTICMSYPTTAQATTLTSLLNKTVRAKGYFAGISSTTGFTVMMKSIEEVLVPYITLDQYTFNYDYVAQGGYHTITYGNLDNPSFGVVYCDAQGNVLQDQTKPAMIAAAQVENNNELYLTVSLNEGSASRTTYLKVCTTNTPVTYYSGLITVTQTGYAPSITVTPTTVEATAAATSGTISAISDIIYSNPYSPEIKYYYYEGETLTETTEAYYSWLTATITNGSPLATNGTINYTISANDDAARTAYMKVYAKDYYNNDVYSELITISQAAPVVDYAVLPFEWEGGERSAFEALNGTSTHGVGDYTNAQQGVYKMKLDGTGDYIQVKTDSQPGKVTIGVKMVGGGDTSYITVKGSTDGQSFDDGEALEISGSQNDELKLTSTRSFGADVRYIRLYFTKGSNVGVGPITISKYTVYDLTVTLGEHVEAIYVFNAADYSDALIEDGAAGTVKVPEGTSIEVSPVAASGYMISSLLINNEDVFSQMVSGSYTFTMTGEVTITATAVEYVEPYHINFFVNGEEFEEAEMAITPGQSLGELPVPSENIPEGFTFVGWMEWPDHPYYNATTAPTMVSSSTVPEDDMILDAVFCISETAQGTYVLSNAAPTDGDWVVLAVNVDGTYYAMNGPAVEALDVANNTIVGTPDAAFEAKKITQNQTDYIGLTKDGGIQYVHLNSSAIKIANGTSNGFLEFTQSGTGYLVSTEATVNNDVVTRYIKYNSTEFTVTTYESEASTLYVFKYIPGATTNKDYTTLVINHTEDFIAEDDNETFYGIHYINDYVIASNDVTNNGKLVVNNEGTLDMDANTLYNSEAANFVIKDGGQYKGNEVLATMEKTIVGYGNVNNKGGWYLLSSPLGTIDAGNAAVTNLMSGPANNYDIYGFDQGATDLREWRNYKLIPDGYSKQIKYMGGVLYGNIEDMTATFTGTLSNGGNAITLDYTEGFRFSGFNIVGNPRSCDAYLYGKTKYYRLQENAQGESELVETSHTVAIAPMEAVFVQAEGEEEEVYFSTLQPTSKHKMINLQVMHNRGQLVDRACVAFGEGSVLGKFQLNENNTKIYFTQGNKDYAVVRSNGQGEMPVNFKAETRGTYTLNVEAENVEMNYLHLIDNMTCADVDLLQTPNYTFEANVGDNVNRFRLVFDANNEDGSSAGSEPFAFFNGSEWVVSNMGEATLQVVDMMGRVLSSETISGNANVNINQAAGIYMLRLVNGENVMVQKVVVR